MPRRTQPAADRSANGALPTPLPEDDARAYDLAVDPNTARQVLRISPDTPLTPALIEGAYAEEAWTRHPSRYPDPEGRAQAEEWASTLATARRVLLAQLPAVAASEPVVAPTAERRRRMSPWAITGIVAGAVAVVALLSVAVIGGVGLVTDAAETVNEAIEEEADRGAGEDPAAPPAVERYSTSETRFTFPAALEVYADGRYNLDCPSDFAEGCWQMALFTEADCDALEVELGFSNDADALLPEHIQSLDVEDVVGDEATPLVFGHDDYEVGWVNQVTCLDAG